MTKKLLTLCLVALVGMFFCTPASAQKKKKDKTSYKDYVWDWNGTLSGDSVFDNYLLEVDTLWNNLQTYKQTYETFTYKTDTLLVNGKPYIMAYMQDKDGNMATKSRVNWQIYNCVIAGTNIVLDATNASLLTASASLALPGLGLNAIVFGKYIKGGPMVIAQGMNQMKEMNNANKANKRSWAAMKNGAIDPATLGVFSDDVIEKMNKCCRIKEIVETDEEYEAIVTRKREKTDEELLAEVQAENDMWVASAVIPEDENTSLDEIDDASFDEDIA